MEAWISIALKGHNASIDFEENNVIGIKYDYEEKEGANHDKKNKFQFSD